MKKKNCLNCKWNGICKHYDKLENVQEWAIDIIECITELKTMSEEDYEKINTRLGELIGGYCKFFEEKEE